MWTSILFHIELRIPTCLTQEEKLRKRHKKSHRNYSANVDAIARKQILSHSCILFIIC